MNRRLFQFATALLWVALPLVALPYRQAWDRLPAHVATHFNAAGHANGWMSREQALNYGFGFTALLLLVFTAILVYIARTRIDAFSWSMLGFSALVAGLMVAVNRSIVDYNLYGSSALRGSLLIAVPIAIVILIVVYIASRREPALPSSGNADDDLLAQETHSGRILTLLIFPALLVPAVVFSSASASVPALRVSMALVGLIGIAAIVAAWTGFEYRFLRHGLEIRALGFRLRSIPRQQIQSYAPESWSPVRGYGIRGIGNSRAYVWGNKVVHIKTTDGDIFLGHKDPARIVRDLDMVMSPGS
ncbi:MAG TPA: DUF1648 domain-containing protein [Terriglobales bacterium]|nr:DUF1648 domain-containing protein [Terriglobales bacterium]